MRIVCRMGLALLIALALSTTASAQSMDDRYSLSAALGSSFANVGTTFAATGALDVKLNDRTWLVGEVGLLPHASLDEASEIAAPIAQTGLRTPDVHSYHWNGNLKYRPFEYGRLQPYLTAGIGSFTADTVLDTRTAAGGTIQVFEDRRRVTDFSSNIGAGARYVLNDWAGVGVDYRTFFVHRENDTPRVNRFTTGVVVTLP